jgi:PAS domain S-box-containing protein
LTADLFCIAGYDGYFKKINPAVSKVFGYTRDELFSKPINAFIHPEDVDITSRNRNEIFENKPLLNFENRYITKNGDIVWLSWTSMPYPEQKLVYAIAKNITHKKQLENERNLLIADLTKINNDLKQLTYSTTHDLRSPVNNLQSLFGLLDVSKIQDEETLEFLKIMKQATGGLQKTLNEFVDVITHKDGLNVNTEELLFSKSLALVLKSIQSLIQNSKTEISYDFSEAESVTFNKTYLESIFLNFITNSIKYARPGIAPVISIRSGEHNGKKQLIYTDNGLGFDMENVQNKLFGLHQKFHNHADSKGIGLYLVHNHITSTGGSISVESKVNEGATFIITFKD